MSRKNLRRQKTFAARAKAARHANSQARRVGTEKERPEERRAQEAARRRMRLKARYAESLIAMLGALLPGAAKVDSPPFHYEIERRLVDLSIKRFCVVAPRGHAKSTVAAIALVLWHIFFEPLWRDLQKRRGEDVRPWRRIEGSASSQDYAPRFVVLVSKTQGEAKKRLETIKNVLGDGKTGRHSKAFRALFGDWGEATASTWTTDKIKLKDGTIILAVGTGQPIRGLNEDHQRPTLLVVDDPEDEENTKTVDRMQANIRWLLNAVEPALDPEVGRLVVIGTPQNAQSMVVRLHESFRAEGAKSDSLWFENDEATVSSRWSVSPGQTVTLEEGDELETDERGSWVRKPQVLWPAWVPVTALREKMDLADNTEGMSLGGYYREYECKVIGDAEQIFKPSFFHHHWTGTLKTDYAGQHYLEVQALGGETLAEPLLLPASVYTGIDPAFSTSQRADRTAMANIACTTHPDRGTEYWELEGVYERLAPTDLLDAIQRNHLRYQPRRGLMEVTAAQVFVAEMLKDQKGIRYVHDRPRSAKKGVGSRIASLEAPMRQGRFWHRKGSPLKGELLSYPRGHDDYADATEKALRMAKRPAHRVEDLVFDRMALLQQGNGLGSRPKTYDPMLA